MIVLLVQFTVKPGAETRVRELMRTMEEHSRKEPGCITYVGHQSIEDPRRFFFYETYTDEAALAAHRNAPYFREYVVNGLDPLIEKRERALFTPVSQ
ncbi:MAG: antibiotic biosynthesis monooxygenase [Acidobacteriota bacterium]|nr:antibiotic biosynthesis monooxygenase [Acidobacteriota bacterium]